MSTKCEEITQFLRSVNKEEYRLDFLLSHLNPSIGLRNLRRYLNYLFQSDHSIWKDLPGQIAIVLYYIATVGGVKADKDFFDYVIAIIYQHVSSRYYGFNMNDFVNEVVDKMNKLSRHNTFSVVGMYFDEGDFYLSWEYIEFLNSYVVFRHPSHISNLYCYYSKKAKVVYNELDKSFFKKLVPIYVSSTCGKIVDVISLVELNHCLDVIAMRYDYPSLSMEDLNSKVRCSTAFSSQLKIHTQKFELQDSFYLSFLNKLIAICYECDEIKSVVSSSNVEHEKAFLFVDTFKNGNHCMVYENVNSNNCTYVFLVEKEAKEFALESIVEYFNSYKANKRETLQYSRNYFRNYGVMYCRRIMHTDRHEWIKEILDALEKAE